MDPLLLDFFTVDYSYVQYLQKAEQNKRGFTHVPNMNYGKNRKDKLLCGIILHINHVNYYAPISSYKIKKPDNLLIRAKNGLVTSSLRFNYMFPNPQSCICTFVINNITDRAYKRLVKQEWNFCNSNREHIYALAERTYRRVLLGKNKGLVANSCDFLFLVEQKCREYKKMHSLQHPLSLDEQLMAAKKEAEQQNANRVIPVQGDIQEPEK